MNSTIKEYILEIFLCFISLFLVIGSILYVSHIDKLQKEEIKRLELQLETCKNTKMSVVELMRDPIARKIICAVK